MLRTEGRFASGVDVLPLVDRAPQPTSHEYGSGGAGGGILLDWRGGTAEFAETAIISANGTTHPDPTANGGTVKLFGYANAQPATRPAITSGRTFTSFAEPPKAGWMLR